MQSHGKTEFVVWHTLCRRCENKTSCSLTNVDFPGDPCPDTYKYMELTYVCRPGRFIIFIFILPNRQQFTIRKEKTKNNRWTKNINTYTTTHTNARKTIKWYTRKTPPWPTAIVITTVIFSFITHRYARSEFTRDIISFSPDVIIKKLNSVATHCPVYFSLFVHYSCCCKTCAIDTVHYRLLDLTIQLSVGINDDWNSGYTYSELHFHSIFHDWLNFCPFSTGILVP